jgi:hypothetical protein
VQELDNGKAWQPPAKLESATDLLPGGKGQLGPMRLVGVGLSQQWRRKSTTEEVGDD